MPAAADERHIGFGSRKGSPVNRLLLSLVAFFTLLGASGVPVQAGLVSGFARGSLNDNTAVDSQSGPVSYALDTSVASGRESLNLFSNGNVTWHNPSSATVNLEDGFTFRRVHGGSGSAEVTDAFTYTFTPTTSTKLTFSYSASGSVINGPNFLVNLAGQQFFINSINPLGTTTMMLTAGQSASIAISSDISVAFPSPEFGATNYRADNLGTFSFTLAPAPEPSTLVMFCTGLPVVAVLVQRRWRKRRAESTGPGI